MQKRSAASDLIAFDGPPDLFEYRTSVSVTGELARARRRDRRVVALLFREFLAGTYTVRPIAAGALRRTSSVGFSVGVHLSEFLNGPVSQRVSTSVGVGIGIGAALGAAVGV